MKPVHNLPSPSSGYATNSTGLSSPRTTAMQATHPQEPYIMDTQHPLHHHHPDHHPHHLARQGYVVDDYIMDPTQQQEYLIDAAYSMNNKNYGNNLQQHGEDYGEGDVGDMPVEDMLEEDFPVNQTNPFLPGYNGNDVGGQEEEETVS